MCARSYVVLYGNSVFLAGIRAELELDPRMEPVAVDTGATDLLERIRCLKPCTLLFDLSEGQPDIALALLHEQPSLQLIGVDPSSDELLVLSNQPTHVVNLSDLIKLIQVRGVTGKESHRER